MERNERLKAADKCASKYTKENEAHIARAAFVLGCEFEAQGQIVKGVVLEAETSYDTLLEESDKSLENIEFDSQVFGKVMSDILAVYKSPSNPEEEPFDYEWTIARHFAEWQKEQMLKDAVEVDVADLNGDIYNYCIEEGLIDEDKVKIVIVPEKEDKK